MIGENVRVGRVLGIIIDPHGNPNPVSNCTQEALLGATISTLHHTYMYRQNDVTNGGKTKKKFWYRVWFSMHKLHQKQIEAGEPQIKSSAYMHVQSIMFQTLTLHSFRKYTVSSLIVDLLILKITLQ